MLRLFGILLLCAAVCGSGFYFANRLSLRRRLLMRIHLALDETVQRIKLGQEREEILSETFSALNIVSIDKSLDVTVKNNILKAEDIRVLTEFFSKFGMGDTQSQIALCQIYSSVVLKITEKASAYEQQKSGLYRICGAAFSAAILILFI